MLIIVGDVPLAYAVSVPFPPSIVSVLSLLEKVSLPSPPIMLFGRRHLRAHLVVVVGSDDRVVAVSAGNDHAEVVAGAIDEIVVVPAVDRRIDAIAADDE